jgi:hypothetical protein
MRYFHPKLWRLLTPLLLGLAYLLLLGVNNLPDEVISRTFPLSLLSGSSRLEKSWAEAKAMPRISVQRVSGTPAYPGDAADVKRAPVHPNLPTGGWNTLALHDPKRTRALSETFLTKHENVIAGYVRFERPGTLRIRAYDDVYGAIYGGWSPATLRLEPSPDYQFVALGQLSVGDGGLALQSAQHIADFQYSQVLDAMQTQEVVWFEEGQPHGTIIWSSSHRPYGEIEPPVGPADLYRESELGDRRFYNHRLAKSVIADLLVRGDLAEARRITDLSIRLWEQQPIANRVERGAHLAYLLLIKLGLQSGEPEAQQTFRQIESLVTDGQIKDPVMNCFYWRNRLPLYRWVALPPGPSLNQLPALATDRVGKDMEAAGIIKFLGTPETHTPRLNSPYELSYKYYIRTWPGNFWVGLRARLEGCEEESQTILRNYLQAHSVSYLDSQPFELAAAARYLK